MSVREIFQLVIEEADYHPHADPDDYHIANAFAHDLEAAGFSQVSIANFVREYCPALSDDDVIEIANRVAP